jgi:acetolactate synthase regulatory subunit
MPTTDRTTTDFTIRAVAEPQALARVLELFVLRGLVPSRFHGRVMADGRLQIDIAVGGLDAGQATHLAARLRNIILVESVLLRPPAMRRSA